MSRRVEDSMADAQRSDDEGCITEDFSDSRGSSETKENIGEVREHPAVNRCQEQSCQASKQIETILKVIYLFILFCTLATRLVIFFIFEFETNHFLPVFRWYWWRIHFQMFGFKILHSKSGGRFSSAAWGDDKKTGGKWDKIQRGLPNNTRENFSHKW